MPFELIKDIPNSYIEDKERKVIFRKKDSYGPEVSIYVLSVDGQDFEIEVEQKYRREQGWFIRKIQYPEKFIGDNTTIQNIALESLTAQRAFFYQQTANEFLIDLAIK